MAILILTSAQIYSQLLIIANVFNNNSIKN